MRFMYTLLLYLPYYIIAHPNQRLIRFIITEQQESEEHPVSGSP